MDVIYLHEIEQRNLLQLFSSGVGRGLRGKDGWGDLTNVQYKPTWNVTVNLPVQQIYPNKKILNVTHNKKVEKMKNIRG
jgi:hypothetical protein